MSIHVLEPRHKQIARKRRRLDALGFGIAFKALQGSGLDPDPQHDVLHSAPMLL
jgi:hypothetical protein